MLQPSVSLFNKRKTETGHAAASEQYASNHAACTLHKSKAVIFMFCSELSIQLTRFIALTSRSLEVKEQNRQEL